MQSESISVGQAQQLVTFHVGTSQAAIPIHEIREIIKPSNITPIPHSPPYFLGMSNLRGEILPIVDLRHRMGLPGQAVTTDSRVIVLQKAQEILGVMVDKVDEVMNFEQDTASHSLTHTEARHLVQQLMRAPNSSRIVMLIDTRVLVPELTEKRHRSHQSRQTQKGDRDLDHKDTTIHEFVSFHVRQKLYAVPLRYVREIIKARDIQSVVNQDHQMDGAIQLRGLVVPIHSIERLLQVQKESSQLIDDGKRIIVMELSGQVIGVAVDSVHRILKVDEASIMPPPNMRVSDAAQNLVTGLHQIDPSNLVMLLDPQLFNFVMSETMQNTEKSEKKDSEKKNSGHEEIQIVCFKLEQQEFGINIESVQEIIRVKDITTVPRSYRYVEGIISLRGLVIPVIDLRTAIGGAKREADSRSRIVVIHHQDKTYGVVVDSVTEVLRTSMDTIQDSPDGMTQDQRHVVKKICKQPNSGRLISLLEVESIIPSEAKAS